jgi:hypothetical protein
MESASRVLQTILKENWRDHLYSILLNISSKVIVDLTKNEDQEKEKNNTKEKIWKWMLQIKVTELKIRI